jgi:GGDEF domain-containing protein
VTARTSAQTARTRAAAPPGARESSAGDQFHLLYAARRAIALLDPASGLQRVRLEGLSPEEPASASVNLLLGIDLVEYYGGGTFETADHVVVSQMKHSQRQPDKAWTAARLCASSRKNGPSVISRLAESFSGFREAHSRKQLLQKLRLRLVSNQPAGGGLVEAVAAAQALIGSRTVATTADLLASGLKRSHVADIRRLANCAALAETAFPDFLGLLDLSECGADARSVQETQLALELRRHLPADVETSLDRVYRRVEREVALVEELKLLARRDVVTGLPNTRGFEIAISRWLGRKTPFLLMTGDVVSAESLSSDETARLQDLAVQLTATNGQAHEVARIGPSQFAVLAPLAPHRPAGEVAAALERRLQREGSTMTFGWAACPQDGEDALALFRAADERLYARKIIRGEWAPSAVSAGLVQELPARISSR